MGPIKVGLDEVYPDSLVNPEEWLDAADIPAGSHDWRVESFDTFQDEDGIGIDAVLTGTDANGKGLIRKSNYLLSNDGYTVYPESQETAKFVESKRVVNPTPTADEYISAYDMRIDGRDPFGQRKKTQELFDRPFIRPGKDGSGKAYEGLVSEEPKPTADGSADGELSPDGRWEWVDPAARGYAISEANDWGKPYWSPVPNLDSTPSSTPTKKESLPQRKYEDKPTTPGTNDGDMSPNGDWEWVDPNARGHAMLMPPYGDGGKPYWSPVIGPRSDEELSRLAEENAPENWNTFYGDNFPDIEDAQAAEDNLVVAPKTPRKLSIGKRPARTLQPGDVTVGDNFTIVEVGTDINEDDQIVIKGYFPGHPVQEKLWRHFARIDVVRGLD
jgi:hypothetical protein